MSKKRKPRPSKVNPSPPERDSYLPQVGVRLPYDQIKELDEFAAESGGRYNRSDLIRRGLDMLLPVLRAERNKRGDNGG
jgi:metal-responsive CopG/Arc/MetJ family transcriptional regulator